MLGYFFISAIKDQVKEKDITMKENRGIILHVCMQGYKNVEQEELSQFLIEFAKARPNECEAQLINKYFSEGNLVKDSKDYQKIAEISQRC